MHLLFLFLSAFFLVVNPVALIGIAITWIALTIIFDGSEYDPRLPF